MYYRVERSSPHLSSITVPPPRRSYAGSHRVQICQWVTIVRAPLLARVSNGADLDRHRGRNTRCIWKMGGERREGREDWWNDRNTFKRRDRGANFFFFFLILKMHLRCRCCFSSNRSQRRGRVNLYFMVQVYLVPLSIWIKIYVYMLIDIRLFASNLVYPILFEYIYICSTICIKQFCKISTSKSIHLQISNFILWKWIHMLELQSFRRTINLRKTIL